MDGILKYGLGEGLSFFSKNTTTTTKKQVLDPLSTIFRLAILKYKPNGTKIGIYQNGIWMQTPGLLQGPLRWSYGDGRDDLHNLYEPIYAATHWYPTTNRDIRGIFNAAIDGLKLLRKIYNKIDDSNLVVHSITHYISMLETAVTDPDSITLKEKIAPWDKMWTPLDMDITTRLLNWLENNEDSEYTEYYLSALEKIIDAKDVQTRRALGSIIPKDTA